MTVNYAPQIIEGLRASVVKRVLVVDDAYDPPALSPGHEGDLLDVLQRPDLRDYVSEDSLGESDLRAATQALLDGEYNHAAVSNANSSLFGAYLQGRTEAVDPGAQFAELKDPALEALDPLLELLQHGGGTLSVRRVGREAALAVSKELQPHLILMDFFLSPPDRATGASTKREEFVDRKSSIALLRELLKASRGATPAVVLMSSGDVEARAQRYRSSLEEGVMAFRFGFLNKRWIRRADGELIAEGDAADVLLDVTGSFEFGRILEAGLRHWKDGAEEGLRELYRELRDLEVKDFAYLMRFRLYQEGTPFADYLEWLLGESVRAVVDSHVEWNTDAFSRLNDEKLTEAIAGAHQAPSSRIAKFFHRIRFDSGANRVRSRFTLGDLFSDPAGRNVRMVITPDCDLVVRNGRQSASRLLTVGGTIRGLGDKQASADNLILFHVPKAITWNLKDVMSHSFGDIAEIQVDKTTYSYYATMRVLPAQTIQKAVLGDLARVGSAVPPIVDVAAPVRVYVKTSVDGRSHVAELEELQQAHAQVFMPRGGSDWEMRALFTSRFARRLVARLEDLDEADLFPDDRRHRRNWIKKPLEVHKALLVEGVSLSRKGLFGMFASIRTPKKKSWLEIVVDISDEALMSIQETDPLARSR